MGLVIRSQMHFPLGRVAGLNPRGQVEGLLLVVMHLHGFTNSEPRGHDGGVHTCSEDERFEL